MHVRWTHRRKVRLLVWIVLLPAFACRIVVPPGFMPAGSAGHGPTMQMCHGAGPLPTTAARADREGNPSPRNGRHHESSCVFAAAGTVAPPPIVLAIVAGPVAPLAQPPISEPTLVYRAIHSAHPARAPPVFRIPA